MNSRSAVVKGPEAGVATIMLAGPSEPVDPKGGNVDLRRAAGDEVGHQPAGDRCGGQAGMAVPEGEVDVAESGRGTDDGQAVRQRRPMRSEERGVGKEGVRTCRSRGAPYQ